MANAKKCDRCGAYYQEVEPNFWQSLAMALSPITMQERERKCISTIETFLDLCPSCSKSLKRWVKGKEEEEDGQQG